MVDWHILKLNITYQSDSIAYIRIKVQLLLILDHLHVIEINILHLLRVLLGFEITYVLLYMNMKTVV